MLIEAKNRFVKPFKGDLEVTDISLGYHIWAVTKLDGISTVAAYIISEDRFLYPDLNMSDSDSDEDN